MSVFDHELCDGYAILKAVDQDDNLVAEVTEGDGFNREQATSHGFLIAAAPEMLAMLERLLPITVSDDGLECEICPLCKDGWSYTDHDEKCELAALLRKAKGE